MHVAVLLCVCVRVVVCVVVHVSFVACGVVGVRVWVAGREEVMGVGQMTRKVEEVKRVGKVWWEAAQFLWAVLFCGFLEARQRTRSCLR